MPPLELIPNISEGRDHAVIRQVAEAMRQPGVLLLDVDGNRAAHRTVLTLVGEAEALIEGAVAGARAATALIDLREHRGVHPRMGALDVCPFVPLQGATMGDAVQAARATAERLGAAGLPAYLYGEAARSDERRLLHRVRRGQFEGLAERMPGFPPDAGPGVPHPTAGAVAVGARFYLVAFNVNLATDDVTVARRIARTVREFKRVRRDARGEVVEVERGRLEAVRAIGWYVDDFGCAQVSTNLVDWRVTPPHVLLRAVREEAAALGTRVTGSELVGCIPLEPLRRAGRSAGVQPDAGDRHLVDRAVEVLGLDAVKPFEPRRKVLEWAVDAARQGAYDPLEEEFPW